MKSLEVVLKWVCVALLSLIISMVLKGCTTSEQEHNKKHIFYLHARIVELHGIHAMSEQFGRYHYSDIIDSLEAFGAQVYHEVRNTETDFYLFCNKISHQVDSLIQIGTVPQDISIIGASKGGVMAMYISNINTNQINYILLGANSTAIEQENDWNLHGNILGIYEVSDSLANKDYAHWKSPNCNIEELVLQTGLRHGFLYKPIKEWVLPVREWILSN